MKKIEPEELKKWMNEHKLFVLIDVREAWERDAFNIGGIHIPVGEIMERKAEIPQNEEVIIYCEKGIRSSIVIQRLNGLGYDNLYNLSGGMSAWKKI